MPVTQFYVLLSVPVSQFKVLLLLPVTQFYVLLSLPVTQLHVCGPVSECAWNGGYIYHPGHPFLPMHLWWSWCLMSSDVIWHIRDKLWPMPKHGSIRKVYACLAVTCHLHFWQNDRDFLRATVVTRGWNGYRNKSQHRKSTLEKKILPPFRQGFEPATFQSRVRCSNHWAIPAPLPMHLWWSLCTLHSLACQVRVIVRAGPTFPWSRAPEHAPSALILKQCRVWSLGCLNWGLLTETWRCWIWTFPLRITAAMSTQLLTSWQNWSKE